MGYGDGIIGKGENVYLFTSISFFVHLIVIVKVSFCLVYKRERAGM